MRELPTDEGKLRGQVALIAGAGRAPGPAVAQALAAQGARIAAVDLSPVLLDPLAQAISAGGGQVFTYVADASRGMPLRAMLDEILEDCEKIDILINNPRISPSAALIEMDEYDWQRTIEMSLNGAFLMTQSIAKQMRERGGGVILNLVDTDPAVLEMPGHAAYAASQAALLAFSQAAAREFIAYNIRVYTLCLRTGLPDQQIGRAAAALCDPQAAQLSGQMISADQINDLSGLNLRE